MLITGTQCNQSGLLSGNLGIDGNRKMVGEIYKNVESHQNIVRSLSHRKWCISDSNSVAREIAVVSDMLAAVNMLLLNIQ